MPLIRDMEGFVFQWTIVLIAIFIMGIEGLGNVQISMPKAAFEGSQVKLECLYDMQGQTLYTVKWYKGRNEFYRFIPKELPNTRMFALNGIDVDLSKSTPNEVVLRNVSSNVSGKYTCEVSSDSPDFETKMDSAYLYVIPEDVDNPTLIVEKNCVEIGDYITANCTSAPTNPATAISWFLNGIKERKYSTSHFNVSLPNRKYNTVTMSTIELPITKHTFENGKAVLACVATVFDLYRGETREILEEARPRPRPSSVLGPRDDRSSDCQRLETPKIGFVVVLLLMHVHR